MEQLDLFTDYTALKAQQEAEDAALERERQIQETMLTIKRRFGKNAILKGMNLEKGATTMERNRQVGGHRA
jgi:DNA polymerase V